MIEQGSLRPDSFINPSLPLYVALPFVWAQQRAAGAGLLAGRRRRPAARDARAVGRSRAPPPCWCWARAAGRSTPRLGAWPAALPGDLAGCREPLPLRDTRGVAAARHGGHARRWRWRTCAARAPAWAVGLALGLTASTKYTAAALALPVLIAVVWRTPGTRRSRHAFTALAAAALAAGRRGWRWRASTALAPRLRLATRACCRRRTRSRSCAGWRAASSRPGAGGIALRAARAARRRLGRARGPPRDRALAGAAVAGFVPGSPYALSTRWRSSAASPSTTRRASSTRAWRAPRPRSAPTCRCSADALTWPLLGRGRARGLLVCVGRALLRREPRRARAAAAALVAPYLLVAASGHQALRFLAPVLPAAAWLAAIGLAALPRAPPPSPGRWSSPRAPRSRRAAGRAPVLRGLAPAGGALAGARTCRPARRSTSSRTRPATRRRRRPDRDAPDGAHALARDGAADAFRGGGRALPRRRRALAGAHGVLLRAVPRSPRAAARARALLPRPAGRRGWATRRPRASASAAGCARRRSSSTRRSW